MQDGTLHSPGNFEETIILRGDVYAAQCPTRQLLDRVGDKWSVLILTLIGEKSIRFNELKRNINGISQKMLSQTLRSLERDGLVIRTVEQTMPVAVSYGITPLGAELLSTLQALINWAETRMNAVSAAQILYDQRKETD
ncbi:MAG: transcriptional regulator [Sphingobium sp.]|nr:transcriptional regulator [Sphingobium sp.]